MITMVINQREFIRRKKRADKELTDELCNIREEISELEHRIEKLQEMEKEVKRDLEYDYQDYLDDYGDQKFHALRDEGKI